MKALVLAVLALSGCYFKTRDTLTENPVSAAQSTTTVVSEQATEVVATTHANVLSFRIATPRQCAMRTVQNVEVTEHKQVTVGVSAWLVPLAVVIPLAYAISLPVTGLIAASRAKSGETYTESRVMSERTFACALPVVDEAGVVRFPSGATFDIRTDKRGIATVFIPDDEIDHGSARIELATVARTVDYDRRSYDLEQLAIEVDP